MLTAGRQLPGRFAALTLVMPLGLLIMIAVWYMFAVPARTQGHARVLVGAAARRDRRRGAAEAVHELTPIDDPPPPPRPRPDGGRRRADR